MHVLLRGDLAQKLRLGSGLILFTFAATHFLNHAVGLIDLEMMYELQQWRWLITRSTAGSVVLLAALATHIGLALYKLANRDTLRLPLWELIQIGLGICIPFLLLPHIVNTRVAHVVYGVQDNYLYELSRLWPDSAILQSTLLLLVWVHGCMGIHFWMRLYGPYRAAQPILLFVAIAIPLAALGGFMVAGRAVSRMISDPAVFEHVKKLSHWPSALEAEELASYRVMVRVQFALILAVVAGILAWPSIKARTAPKFPVTYSGGPTVKAFNGPTLLEISRMNRVPHASMCGGRARCSTCRVRIDQGADTLPLPLFPEAVTLASIAAPPNVRLACQIRPTSPLTITRLLRPSTVTPESVDLQEANAGGVEKSLAVLFLDMRGFTRLSEKKMPYDVVFFLNEFFSATGSAITMHDGWIDKFLGDGLLAVFGEHHGLETGCRQALRAARAIDLALDHINAKLEPELGRPLEVGMGIDAGPLLIGRIGFGPNIDLTVIGSAVNVASRLEAQTKEKGVQIVLSTNVARHAGWEVPPDQISTVRVRGLAEPLEVIAVGRGRDLPARILAYGADEKQEAGSRLDPMGESTGI